MSYPPPQDPWAQRPPVAPGQHAGRPPHQPRPQQRSGHWFTRLGLPQQLGISVLGIVVIACCGVSTLAVLSPGDGDKEPAAAPATTTPSRTTPPAVTATAPDPTPVTTTASPRPTKTASKAAPKPVYYGSCTAVRNAGKAPLRKGQPGYRSALDRDGDGRACESSEGPAPGTGDEDEDDGGSSSVYYKNCAAVRAAGADPIRRGDPGYGRHLDRDGDGVACE
ncbi:excalibur calcium-binding domain-containing protein [Plantactinospora soyae]|uniref:Excalibur calcium-binding domain-containing protein n=1 Tax=Plantactinospora soyae TaxID=1544732 RepID=A0A927M1G0_9ACTN|nr:excalibur calcium-binding domain-containing protein [Plantactinospora soyae]MBE1485869.1 hypothetical protein [Plantactinospora soyae]